MKKTDKIVILSSDHNGVVAKSELVEHLKKIGYFPIDIGPNDSSISVDYVDYSKQASSIISKGQAGKCVLICGTGVGLNIVANRFPGVRAVLAHSEKATIGSRDHNNSNVLCLGSWISSIEEMKSLLDVWINKKWGEGRHVKRVERIDQKEGIVFTNGVFDFLHYGHLELLKFAKTQGTKLVVAIDSDQRVKRIKGPNRPFNNEDIRKNILESNKFVDEVIIFNSKNDLSQLYDNISPNIVVKGGEVSQDQVRINDNIPHHIEIKIFPLIPNISTTETLTKISGDPNKWAKKEYL